MQTHAASTRPVPRLTAARDDLFLLSDRVLFVGALGDTWPHAVHAVKILVAYEGQFQIRFGNGPWQQARSAIVAPDEVHAVRGSRVFGHLAFILPERDGERYAIARSQISVPGLERLPHDLSLKVDESRVTDWLDAFFARAAECTARKPLDLRIARALEYLRFANAITTRLDPLSRSSALSPSRFSHLFREETAIPFRTYAQLMRIRAAVAYLGEGLGLSEAALASGFADHSHFGRSFRRMFGTKPGALVHGGRIHILGGGLSPLPEAPLIQPAT
ncbi:helix-turn-helix domain-containing protein [Pendulispora albinea]|uniref:AraC family transcriptional regulator n=1 Tax=Pendulispora albinea TaxID=2741071 RepID=A0ABZ2LRT7_9BACT